MTQRSFHWDGASLGDAEALTVNAADGIGYRLANEDYESPFVDIGMRMLFNGDEDRGVLNNWLNELAVTGVATPVAVDTGGAVIYGMPYENTVAVNVAVAAPTTDVRQDLIVLRRDWAAQTIRITLITGVEGGGVPAHTQSPAPDGDGIYDIPLASLSTTVGAVITVTDLREFCTFGTAFATDALGSTQLANNSVAWADRETRTKRLFVGGGELEPAITAGRYSYGNYPSYTVMSATPPWNGAANEESWRLVAAPTYQGVYTHLYIPPADWATGDITTYIWFVVNAAVVTSFTLRSGAQLYAHSECPISFDSLDYAYDSSSTSIGTGVVSDVWRREGVTLPEASFAHATYPKTMIHYQAWWYNSSGVEDINIMGIEFVYTGYG